MSSTVDAPYIVPRYRRLLDWLRAFSSDWFATGALGLFVVIILGAVFANILAPHDPFHQNLLMRLKPPVGLSGGSWSYPFGTDLLGRDILSRIMYGGRWSLGIGFAVVLVGGTVGTVVGLLTGYFGGWIDAAVMRYIDFQTSIPYFLLALTIMAAIGPGARNLIIVLAIGSWPLFARFARSIMLSLKHQAFIEAARVGGANEMTIMVRHAFPNMLSPLTTLSTLELSRVILSEAGLSYLGMGVQPPSPAWGLMVSEAHDYVATANWTVTIPGFFILLTVLSINIFANRLRRSTDPLQRGRA